MNNPFDAIQLPDHLKEQLSQAMAGLIPPSPELCRELATAMSMPIETVEMTLNAPFQQRASSPTSLPEYKVTLTPVDENRELDVYDDEMFGNRTKFGGKPDFIQIDAEDIPNCSNCNQAMTFVAQIDSLGFDAPSNPNRANDPNRKWMFMDVGMIYVFYCFGCFNCYAVADT